MSKIINNTEIEQFKKDGAILIKGKFNNVWIEKLKEGIQKGKKNPSPRFTNHTKDKNLPGYYEDFWTWDLHDEFKDFVFNSPTPKIAAELLEAKKVNLVMDNWFFREAVQNRLHLSIMIYHILILKDQCVYYGYHLSLLKKKMVLLGLKDLIYGIDYS